VRLPPLRYVGIGASAGGIDALLKLLAQLPADLPHTLLIVLHVPAHGQSVLADILDRRCKPAVLPAEDGALLLAGHAYVAPPDRHLTVRGASAALTKGPRENSVRPAVDTLLRSLAAEHGPASVAVVLSGALVDGAAGARAVAEAGGTVFVQDPCDALVSSMPAHAIAAAGDAARVLDAGAIGTALVQLAAPPEIEARPLAGAGT
jgi:two-component system chemotaxis response regulator CheB